MDIFNQGKELLQDVFYTDIRHFKNFVYMRSIFTEKWYNLIVPSVPPSNLDWYMAYKILDEEARSKYEVSFYVPHHLYAAYKPVLQQRHFNQAVDDVYVRYCLNGAENRPAGDFREVNESNLELFIALGEKCFPDWPNQAEYSRKCLSINREMDQIDDVNGKYNTNVLLYENGEAVAFGSLLFSRRMKLGYIHNVGTAPSFQRKGYFMRLIHYLLNVALHEDIEVVYANVENNGASFHGFLKLGFQENCRYHLFGK